MSIFKNEYFVSRKRLGFQHFVEIKAGVIVVPCAVRATAVGIKLVGVPQPKLVHRFSPNFQGMFTVRGSRAD